LFLIWTETLHKEALGMRAAEAEGAKFWLSILNELKNRGVKDILIACVDGLKGFSEYHKRLFAAHLYFF
jgi:transposase-like protein